MKKHFLKYIIVLLVLAAPFRLFAQVHVSLPDTSAKKNTFIYIPVNVTDLTKKNVKSYEFTVSFNRKILKAEGISKTNSLTNAFTWKVDSQINKSSIKVDASGIFALSGKGILIYLIFKVVGSSGSTNLIFNSFVFNSGNPSAIKHNGKFTVYYEKLLKIKKTGNGKGKVSINDIEYNLPFEKLLQGGITYKLFAIPDTGSRFVHWEGDISSTENPYYIKLENDLDIDVKFNLKRYTISLEKNPSNGGTVNGEGKYSYGKSVTIKAIPKEDWHFDNWTENDTIVSVNAKYTFTVKKNRILTANFSAEKILINANIEPVNSGLIIGLGEYLPGEIITLTAQPNTGWSFLEWKYSDSDTAISNNPVIEIVVTNNLFLEAKFSKNLYSVITTSNPVEGGAVSGGGYFYYGQKAELLAIPNTGWEFINWTYKGNEISDKEKITVNINSNINYAANFKKLLYSLTASSQPSEGGIINGGGFYFYNQKAIITANANEGWKFENWTINDSIVSTEETYEILVKENTNLKANFSLITDINKENKLSNFIDLPYPNPFNPTTTFRFGIKTQSIVTLYLYDITGKLVKKLIDSKYYSKGIYRTTLNADNMPSGVYFYKFTSLAKISDNNIYQSGKILLIK